MPILCASLSQLYFPRIFQQKNLGHGIVFFIFIQILGLIGILYTSLIPANFYLITLFLTLYWIGGQNAAPLWIDYVGTIFGKRNFNKFIASRNSFVLFITLFCYVLFSYLFKQDSFFKTAFIIGSVARTISLLLNVYLIYKFPLNKKEISKSYEEDDIPNKEEVFKIFLIWGAFFRFSVGVSSPFFILYMSKDLALSISQYVWLTAIPLLGRALFQKNWAMASENNRPYFGIQISTLFISVLPWLWTFSTNYTYLIILQILSGLFWGGIELTHVLMIQNHTFGNSRRLMGIQQFWYMFAATIGAALGGILIYQNIDIFTVFNISTGCRFFVAVILLTNLRTFQMTRLTLKEGSNYLVSVLSIRPSMANITRALPTRRRKTVN